MPLELKEKFSRMTIRPSMPYGIKGWGGHMQKMRVADMRIPHWMFGLTRKDKIKNEDIRSKLGAAQLKVLEEELMVGL
ncbi:hypothetical protein DVH24_020978 [Malus domestica]|uniref:Uncharacterized protein n=1 Tax=Malus domestica TaxID=3750 RepID=A0A498JAT5_MALDO|nr:hypothetical protein DVH24_020978 [Malus domestica]